MYIFPYPSFIQGPYGPVSELAPNPSHFNFLNWNFFSIPNLVKINNKIFFATLLHNSGMKGLISCLEWHHNFVKSAIFMIWVPSFYVPILEKNIFISSTGITGLTSVLGVRFSCFPIVMHYIRLKMHLLFRLRNIEKKHKSK